MNILSAEQHAISREFAATALDKYGDVQWRASPSGSPIIGGALAWIDCAIDTEHKAGDHWIVVGRVSSLGVADAGAPLIFYRGGYGAFHPWQPATAG